MVWYSAPNLAFIILALKVLVTPHLLQTGEWQYKSMKIFISYHVWWQIVVQFITDQQTIITSDWLWQNETGVISHRQEKTAISIYKAVYSWQRVFRQKEINENHHLHIPHLSLHLPCLCVFTISISPMLSSHSACWELRCLKHACTVRQVASMLFGILTTVTRHLDGPCVVVCQSKKIHKNKCVQCGHQLFRDAAGLVMKLRLHLPCWTGL